MQWTLDRDGDGQSLETLDEASLWLDMYVYGYPYDFVYIYIYMRVHMCTCFRPWTPPSPEVGNRGS